MIKKEQTKNKITQPLKPFVYAPFGLIPAAILTSQTLARVKLQNKNNIELQKCQDGVIGLSKKFI